MYDTLLFMHFFGVSIGAGTGIYLFALQHHAAHHLEQAEARTLLPGLAAALSRVGNLGLIILIVSGLAMASLVGASIWSSLFLLKLLLVMLLVVFVGLMNYLAARVRHAFDKKALTLMQKLKFLGPLLGMATLLTAVLAFH